MNDILVAVVGTVAALNPAAAALAARSAVRLRDVAIAAGVAAVVFLAAVLLADPGLDLLDVTPESFRVAAGIVMILAGAQALVGLRWGGDWQPGDARHPVHPLGIPILATPAAVAAAVNYSANEGIDWGLLGAATALVLGSAALVTGPRRAFGTVSRFTGVLLIVIGVAEIVDGVKSV